MAKAPPPAPPKGKVRMAAMAPNMPPNPKAEQMHTRAVQQSRRPPNQSKK